MRRRHSASRWLSSAGEVLGKRQGIASASNAAARLLRQRMLLITLLAEQAALELEIELVVKLAPAAAQMLDNLACGRAVLSLDPVVEKPPQQWSFLNVAGRDAEACRGILQYHVDFAPGTFDVFPLVWR